MADKLPAALKKLETANTESGFDMSIDRETGSLLRSLAASKPVGRILELGTGTGSSTAWLAQGMDADTALTTVELEPESSRTAQAALSGDPRIDFLVADGNAFLETYDGPPFDLIFADAMPGKFENLDRALALVAPGGIYFCDDLLPQSNWPDNHQPRVDDLLVTLKEHDDFWVTYLDYSTGLALAVRRG